MFWSGVKELVHEYAANGQRYVTLEDTLIGYLAEGLVFCGQESAPGMNYSRCPSWWECPFEAGEAFWAHASQTFASAASGQVTVMLDGSSTGKPAYRQDSFFGKYELPYLKKGVVTNVRVFLVHALDAPMSETCLNGSLKLLEEDVVSRGFSFSCLDDPLAILHLLCVDEPADRECKLATDHVTSGGRLASHSFALTRQPLIISAKLDRFDGLPSRG
ncbi:hypothetical protein C0Q70_20898 [Pomacea canaliculata]|uniref:Uncharacterized protein n=2 Tax=Pomacea canaliculata TaxID=400727 RepID=A0A2T7NB14_POMCA|nr:hypothetical protein C0Q70_20898 [Pomacea canaliculata]